jgi:hypothetical protein
LPEFGRACSDQIVTKDQHGLFFDRAATNSNHSHVHNDTPERTRENFALLDTPLAQLRSQPTILREAYRCGFAVDPLLRRGHNDARLYFVGMQNDRGDREV